MKYDRAIEPDRSKQIERASWLGIVGNGLLSVLKISAGIAAGSFAVVSDGIDSANDILTSLVTLISARVAVRRPTARFPYGYTRADTIATKLLSFVIFFAGAELIISAIRHILADTPTDLPSPLAVYVTLVSIAAKIFLAYYKISVGRRVNSSMLVADGKNMQNDVIISVAVLAGLVATHALEMPVLDSITALVVSVWIIRVAFKIFMESNTELMDGLHSTRVYDRVFEAVGRIPEAESPHRVRARHVGHLYVIDLDIEVDPELSVVAAHDVAQQTEEMIRAVVPNVYDVVVHVEPRGNAEGECFGVSEDDRGPVGRGCYDEDQRG
ncbi:MAG: cation diffusion facilitator family transporter [Spirochaetia bacterium]